MLVDPSLITPKHFGDKIKNKMVTEDAYKVLEYLKKHDQVNTFRLSRELGINRRKILNIIKKLEEKELVEFKLGKAKFLKFPIEEKQAIKKPKPKKKIKIKVKKPSLKKAESEKKVELLEDIQIENKKLKERMLKLKSTIKELEQKANVPPKIIRKIIIKEVPIKYVKEHVKEKIIKKKKKAEPQKFKTPKFDMAWIKDAQHMLKIIEQKIKKPKINFAKLNKSIQQLHIPRILKKP